MITAESVTVNAVVEMAEIDGMSVELDVFTTQTGALAHVLPKLTVTAVTAAPVVIVMR